VSLLLRSSFDRYASPETRQTFVEGLLRHLRRVEVTQLVSECSDPKDDQFLALALAVNAEMIVASDPHLTQIHPWRAIPILPPAAFLVCAR
jgi:predicted nucleic acid-binding protein